MSELPVRVDGGYVGTLRVVGTLGHVIALNGKRLPLEPAVQHMMNRCASRFSKGIRHLN